MVVMKHTPQSTSRKAGAFQCALDNPSGCAEAGRMAGEAGWVGQNKAVPGEGGWSPGREWVGGSGSLRIIAPF